jgi:hypothetical protein
LAVADTSYRKNTKLYTYVLVMTGISVVCFVVAIITQFTHCLPLHHNWQILPDPGKECSAGIIINIVIAVGNVLVDALLLVIPTLMLKDAQINVWRKARIGFLLSLGVFVMAMAIARCILSIGSSVQVAQASVWAQREAVSCFDVHRGLPLTSLQLVSIFAVNAPIINALFKTETWRSGSSTNNSYVKQIHSSDHSRADRSKNNEIYKMTNTETSSKESTSDLVAGGAGPSHWDASTGDIRDRRLSGAA